jgi:hypothetical protein
LGNGHCFLFGAIAWLPSTKNDIQFYPPFHKQCPKHHEHKEDPGVTPMTCGAGDERAQVILMWVRAPGVGIAFHPWGLGVTKVRSWVMCSLWCAYYKMLNNISIGDVRCEIWQYEWGVVPGHRPG